MQTSQTRPANEEASGDLVVLVDGSVQEGLLAARGPCAPTCRVAAMADLHRTNMTQWPTDRPTQHERKTLPFPSKTKL